MARPIERLRESASLRLTTAILLASVAIFVQADVPDVTKPLTLEDCITIGLANASSIKTAELDVQLSDLRVKDAKSAYLPSINTQGRYSFDDRVDFGFKRDNYNLDVTADYLLWDQGRRRIALEQQRYDRDASASRLERSKQQLVFRIVQAYYRLLEAEKLLALDDELLASSRNNAARVRAQFELEKAIEADVAAAEVRVANDELNRLNDENAVNIARANLPTVLGLDPATPIEIEDDPTFERYRESSEIERYDKTLEATVALALQQRPDVVESALSLRVLELSRKQSQLDRYPRLSAQGNFSARVDDYLAERDDFGKYRSWSAAATVSFPIFDGGERKRAVERADLQLERVRQQDAELRRNVALEVRQEYLSLIEAERRLAISAAQVRNARLSLDVTAARFEEELAFLLELLEAQAQYGQATTNQIRAFYDYKIAQRALQNAIGTPIK
jgi:outer membrane protein TolC